MVIFRAAEMSNQNQDKPRTLVFGNSKAGVLSLTALRNRGEKETIIYITVGKNRIFQLASISPSFAAERHTPVRRDTHRF